MKANNVEVNPETVKSFLFGGVLKQCGAYDDFHPHKDESGKEYLTFTHNKGIKWSRIIGKVYSTLLIKQLNLTVEKPKLLKDCVVITYREKNLDDMME